jgi:asparagine synthase (glutamine-hydrolysing)
MCGINLILDKKTQLTTETIERMNFATRHRGPEQMGVHVEALPHKQLFFGHNRLKIIDLSDNASQPFISFDKRYVLIYNGEIYHYQDLKRQLTQQYPFRSESDTEVLLYWLIEHTQDEKTFGDALQKLNGMYAFVLYDCQEQRLWIGRDRLGIKPLYVYEDAKYLIISSEIKGILASRLVKKELNPSQIFIEICSKTAYFFQKYL